MTIAENETQGNEAVEPTNPAVKKGFFTSEELDLLDIQEAGSKNGRKMALPQTAVIVLVLTALASFALGMLAERSIDSTSGVVGQGTSGNLSGNAAASNAVTSQVKLTVPQPTK